MKSSLLAGAIIATSFGLTGCPATDKSPSPAPLPSAPLVASSSGAPPAASSATRTGWGPPGAQFLADSPFTMLMHADTPLQLLKGKKLENEADVHLSLPRMRKGKVGAFASVLFVDSKYHEQGTVYYCNRVTKKVDAVLREHADSLRPALTVADFEKNWTSGHASLFRTLEGSWCLQNKLESINQYFATGTRMIGLTWQDDHDFATSWTYYGHVGLTALGKKAVVRMNQLGIAVDVSHMSDRAVEDVLAIAKAPVFASHSNARAVCDHPRNLKDEHIRRIAATGGVVGVNFYSLHLRKKGKATLSDVVTHIRHIRDVGGIQSVALGSDFDGISRGPKGLETAAELPNLRKALEDDGFTEEHIAAIFGGNFLRAMKGVEDKASE